MRPSGESSRSIPGQRRDASIPLAGPPKALQICDLVLGCVDSFTERHQLEACCRRHLIPYIDIGMDVHPGGDGPPAMTGQVILSMPGGPCMWCMNFLTEEKLGREANNYGAAGGRPQVVWSNGVLASTAVGLAVEVLTNWTRSPRNAVFLSYRGNEGTINPDVPSCNTRPRSVRTIRPTRSGIPCSRNCDSKSRQTFRVVE